MPLETKKHPSPTPSPSPLSPSLSVSILRVKIDKIKNRIKNKLCYFMGWWVGKRTFGISDWCRLMLMRWCWSLNVFTRPILRMGWVYKLKVCLSVLPALHFSLSPQFFDFHSAHNFSLGPSVGWAESISWIGLCVSVWPSSLQLFHWRPF